MLTVDGKNYDLNLFVDIIVIGAGKAAASMAKAIEEILEDCITEGLITVKYDHSEKLSIIEIQEARHPVPDQNGAKSTSTLY